jgi:hypothetical protein
MKCICGCFVSKDEGAELKGLFDGGLVETRTISVP